MSTTAEDGGGGGAVKSSTPVKGSILEATITISGPGLRCRSFVGKVLYIQTPTSALPHGSRSTIAVHAFAGVLAVRVQYNIYFYSKKSESEMIS